MTDHHRDSAHAAEFPDGIEFSAVNRQAPGYREHVERLAREGGGPLYEDKCRYDPVREAALALYHAGRWEIPVADPDQPHPCPADAQAALWERLRDALGLRPGTATALGFGRRATPAEAQREFAAIDREVIRELISSREVENKRLRERVQGLLEANNREVERRRAAEAMSQTEDHRMTEDTTIGCKPVDYAPVPWGNALSEPHRYHDLVAQPVLIGLCSRAMGSGKTAVADHLVNAHGFTRLKFAGPLKAMTRALLAEIGEDDITIQRQVEGDLKEIEIPALKRSCREVMQLLGTEFGRNCLHPNVWADIVRQRALRLLAAGQSVVIDDMRYLNELDALTSIGGTPARVIRSSATVTVKHSSEGELDGVAMEVLDNDWPDLEALHSYIDKIWLPRLVKSLNK